MRLFLTTALCALIATTAVAQPATNYTSKTPYAPQQALSTYQKPPAGFTAVFTEHVARHGSRGLSSKKYDDLSLQMWEAADKAGALTPLGRELGPQIRGLMAANEKLGYGNLTHLGIREHRETAQRVYKRLPGLFAAIAAKGERIEIVSSGEPRAIDSGTNFAEGLVEADARLKPLVEAPRTDRDKLYFHKVAANADYRTYQDEDPQLLAVMGQLHALPRTKVVAHHMLERLFTRPFIDQIAAGKLKFTDRGDGDTTVGSEVDAALAIYNLLLIAPAMRDEGQWSLEKFIQPADADWLAYLTDAEDFYSKGPAFTGRDITYRMAQPLLDDFFNRIDAETAGTSKDGAVFRFAHAEIIIPLAALMRLPGSTKAQGAGDLYTYANNPWRGAKVSPMAANVQWDLFRNGDRYLVRMLYNERETPFKDGCRPVVKGSYFYAVDELKRCFGRTTR